MANDNYSADMQEIWSLFAQEGRDNLALAETALLQLEQDRGEAQPVAALFRAIHSFKGGARMMGLSVLEAVAHHAEDLIALVRDEGVALQDDLIEALFAALDKSRVLLDHVVASGCDPDPIEAQATLDTLHQLLACYQPAAPVAPLLDEQAETVRGEEPVPALSGDLADETDQADLERALGALADRSNEPLTPLEEAPPDRSEQPDSPPPPERADIAGLYRRWQADRVLADLARLHELADQLDRLTQRFTVEIDATRQIERLTGEAVGRLRAIAHSCVLYRINQAVQVTLAMEDLYARVAQAELLPTAALIQLTREYIARLGAAITARRDGAVPELDSLTALLDQIESVLSLHADGPAYQTVRQVLDALDLAPQFKDVMTPEAWSQLGQSLQAGAQLYTVLADLERNEAVGQAFFEWSCSAGIQLITNITVAGQAGSMFEFLVATTRDGATLAADLAQLDPSGQYLTLKVCALRPDFDLRCPFEQQPATPGSDRPEPAISGGGGISAAELAHLIETAGELAVHHATLRRVTGRLADTDLLDPILNILQAAHGDWARARRDLKLELADRLAGVHTLGQVERDLGVALDHLQASVRRLRLAPVTELLAPLRRLVQDLGRQLNKPAKLTLHGLDLEMERAALRVLAEPLRQLVWFALAHSLENAERRRALGKPATGHIVVTVDPHDDHLRVIVEDDGAGLDRGLIAQRAQDLHWIEHGRAAADEVDLNLVLRPGFGRVGGAEGIDLAALHDSLQAQHGRLSVAGERDHGVRFTLYLPLDMAVVDGMVVRAGSLRYVIPLSAIRRIVQPAVTDLVQSSADGHHTLLRTEGEVVRIRALGRELGGSLAGRVMVIVDSDHDAVALAVDELIGRQQVMARPLQGHLLAMREASGCALLGEGEVGMILNLSLVGASGPPVFDQPHHAAPILEAARLC